MPKIQYKRIDFSSAKLAVIKQANAIIATYAAQGFDLTLRQVYYQFVARDLIPNKQSEYKKLGEVINEARLAGLIDWSRIVDRTRNLDKLSSWGSPDSIIESAASSYHRDLWVGQAVRPEVWIEKDALEGVIEGVCRTHDTPFFSCRGYTSQTAMWDAAQRLMGYVKNHAQAPVILHFGDHDPSGKDMSRDIRDRLALFMGTRYAKALVFERLALNMNQIDQYNPPPNPCKITDSRAAGYIAEFGHDSWELDALEPAVIVALIDTQLRALKDGAIWDARVAEQEAERGLLNACHERWGEVEELLS
jgi:hypothetical protein